MDENCSNLIKTRTAIFLLWFECMSFERLFVIQNDTNTTPVQVLNACVCSGELVWQLNYTLVLWIVRMTVRHCNQIWRNADLFTNNKNAPIESNAIPITFKVSKFRFDSYNIRRIIAPIQAQCISVQSVFTCIMCACQFQVYIKFIQNKRTLFQWTLQWNFRNWSTLFVTISTHTNSTT